jgi:hypothetical protein
MENILPSIITIWNDLTASQLLNAIAKDEDERRYHGAISLSLSRALQSSKPPRELSEWPMAFLWLTTVLNDHIHRALPRWIHFDAKVVQLRWSLRVNFCRRAADTPVRKSDRVFRKLNALALF